jgi:surfeit locus 1 family protein
MRVVLRPRWLVGTIIAVLLIVLFVNLGFWQLRRLDERKAFNATVRANATAAPAPLPADVTPADVDALEWRPVTVEGRFRPGADVLVANRVLDGQPGYWLVTPLDPADGSAPVAVVRGFVTRTLVAEGALGEAAAPTGDVEVTGYVQKSRSGGRFATGNGDGGLPEITRVDVPALGEQWGSEPAPLWLQMAAQGEPAAEATLTPVPLPTLDNGPHLSYAFQWFIFSTIAVIGYPLILRRNARAGEQDDENEDEEEGGSGVPIATAVRGRGGIH